VLAGVMSLSFRLSAPLWCSTCRVGECKSLESLEIAVLFSKPIGYFGLFRQPCTTNRIAGTASIVGFHISRYAKWSPIDRAHAQAPQALPPIEVYFSLKGGCTEAVVKEIDATKSTILVQAYSFTSAPIAKALVEAHKRGITIEVILDMLGSPRAPP
jgi:hypothetical protein